MSGDVLLRKYHNDPLFHALVHALGCSSFVNDNGVICEGPSMADARRVHQFLDALPDCFAKVDGETVWLRKVVDTSGHEPATHFVIVAPTMQALR